MKETVVRIPSVGTGRMLLYASNLSCRLFGMDIDKLVVDICLCHGAVYAAWLRDTYGDDFAQGYRSDAQLGTVLDREGLSDLSELLKKKP